MFSSCLTLSPFNLHYLFGKASHFFYKIKAASGNRVIEKRLQFNSTYAKIANFPRVFGLVIPRRLEHKENQTKIGQYRDMTRKPRSQDHVGTLIISNVCRVIISLKFLLEELFTVVISHNLSRFVSDAICNRYIALCKVLSQ